MITKKIAKWVKDKFFPISANKYAETNFLEIQINKAMSRAAAASINRRIDVADPLTWEFSGFSQNGEDGILDYLISKLKKSNKYFVEIGASNGIENNTAYLGHVKKFGGLMIEGNLNEYKLLLLTKPWLVNASNIFVQQENIATLLGLILHKDPDVFSLDIDGNDFHVCKLLLDNGFRPKIIVVEYNSAFGPEKSITIEYEKNFNMFESNYPYLHYGASILAWKNLLCPSGYKFITVESNGVNAFFVDANCFDLEFLELLKGIDFQENKHQYRLFKTTWEGQFDLVKDKKYTYV
jgi:hypothetical protein